MMQKLALPTSCIPFERANFGFKKSQNVIWQAPLHKVSNRECFIPFQSGQVQWHHTVCTSANAPIAEEITACDNKEPAEHMVDQLLVAIANTDSGAAVNPADRQDIDLKISALEDYGKQQPPPVTNPLIFGNYNVAYVSSARGYAPAGGRFRVGLGRLLFQTRNLCQSVLPPDVVTNKLEFALFGVLPGAVGLRGRLEAQDDGTTVKVLFDPPRISLPGGICLPIGPQSSVVLSTTYLDKRVRLGKGSQGSLFVFTRGGQADAAGMDRIGLEETSAWGWLLLSAVFGAMYSAAALLINTKVPVQVVCGVTLGLLASVLLATVWRGGQQ